MDNTTDRVRQISLDRPRLGFSIRELLILVTAIAVLLALAMPAIQAARESARRMSCNNNLKQIGLSIHNYHAAFKQLPSLMSGTESNRHQLSGLVAILPFLESSARWDTITNPVTYNGINFPSMGPRPDDPSYDPWLEHIITYACPSEFDPADGPGRTNYALSVGDQILGLYDAPDEDAVRGLFAPGLFLRFRDCLDGLSNTIMAGEIANRIDDRPIGNLAIGRGQEIATQPGRCHAVTNPDYPTLFTEGIILDSSGRGARFADGRGGTAWITTILPPNSPSCAIQTNPLYEGLFSLSSRHAEGAHVLMADGAVFFFTDNLDHGDSSAAPVTGVNQSPYGLWGALGSRSSREIVEEQLVL